MSIEFQIQTFLKKPTSDNSQKYLFILFDGLTGFIEMIGFHKVGDQMNEFGIYEWKRDEK